MGTARHTPAGAECIVPGRWWLDHKSVEFVFSGTLIAVERTAPLAFAATFDVDRVWKGQPPKRLQLHVWETRSEMPPFEAFTIGRRFMLAARRLTDARERDSVGLVGTNKAAFRPAECGAFQLDGPESARMMREFGIGRPPRN